MFIVVSKIKNPKKINKKLLYKVSKIRIYDKLYIIKMRLDLSVESKICSYDKLYIIKMRLDLSVESKII